MLRPDNFKRHTTLSFSSQRNACLHQVHALLPSTLFTDSYDDEDDWGSEVTAVNAGGEYVCLSLTLR